MLDFRAWLVSNERAAWFEYLSEKRPMKHWLDAAQMLHDYDRTPRVIAQVEKNG